jgi:hypothetical protein
VLGLATCVPAAQIANAIISIALSAADFWVNKVLVGLYPATLTSFDLSVTDSVLRQGQITDASLLAVARNDPAPVTLTELVDNSLTVLGLANALAPCGGLPAFRDVAFNAVDFLLSLVRLHISTYGTLFGIATQVNLVSIPDLSWQADVISPRLVERRGSQPGIIDGDPLEVNWRASNTALGDGAVYAFPEGPPAGLVLTLPAGVQYTGRAFGENPIPSNHVPMKVRAPAAVELDFPFAVAPGVLTPVDVRAGYLDPGDVPVWKPGIPLTLTVQGGSLEASSGVTDANGRFQTRAFLTPGSSQIIIDVTATPPFADPASHTAGVVACAATVPAPPLVGSTAANQVCSAGIAVAISGYNKANIHADGVSGGCVSPETDIPWTAMTAIMDFSANGTCFGTVLGDKDATASGIATSSYTFANGPFVLSGTISTAGDVTTEAVQGRADAMPRVTHGLQFVITEPMDYQLTGSLTGVHASKSSGIVYQYAAAGLAFRRLGGPTVLTATAVDNFNGTGPASIPLSSSGQIQPGTYMINVFVEVITRAVQAPGLTASASSAAVFTLRLTP